MVLNFCYSILLSLASVLSREIFACSLFDKPYAGLDQRFVELSGHPPIPVSIDNLPPERIVDFIKIENLCTFDGVPGFSLAQGQ